MIALDVSCILCVIGGVTSIAAEVRLEMDLESDHTVVAVSEMSGRQYTELIHCRQSKPSMLPRRDDVHIEYVQVPASICGHETCTSCV